MIKATNLNLEIAKEEVQKKQKIVKKQKVEAAAAKQQKDRGNIGSSNEYDNNYYSDMNDTDPDQEDNLNPVSGCNGGKRAENNMD